MTRVDAAVARRCAPRSAGAQLAEQGSDGERALETQLRQVGIGDWVRELQPVPERGWRVDFAWPTEQLAVEVEGGTWTAGRHSRGKGFEADCRKYNELAIRGWLVIRVTTDMVTDGRAIALITRALWSISQRRNGR